MTSAPDATDLGAIRTDSAPGFADSVGLAIITAGRQAQQIFDAELAAIGLTMRHLGALGHLARSPDPSISELARRSGVTAQSMHATVRGLEERGAVRTDDQGRGRPAKITVTPEGHALLNQARQATAALDARLAMRFGKRDAETLRRILTPLIAWPKTTGSSER